MGRPTPDVRHANTATLAASTAAAKAFDQPGAKMREVQILIHVSSGGERSVGGHWFTVVVARGDNRAHDIDHFNEQRLAVWSANVT